MSRDDFNDPGAATWGNPGAVTVGYIPEEEPSKLRFETSPQRDHTWRELKIVSGKIEGRDLGDESDNVGGE
jgi:hypothetical protein